MKALILTNGEYGDYRFCKELEQYDFIICADNGMKHARYLGLLPNLIVGDFDSSPKEDLLYYKEKGVKVESFSSVKDETDTEIALDRALEMGIKEITIYGGIGSRLDHTLGNVQLLYKALAKGCTARLMNPYNIVYLINSKIELEGQIGQLVSLLPLSFEVEGVNTVGLAYSLENATFELGKPYGISNYMIKERASVEISKGYLLVILATD